MAPVALVAPVAPTTVEPHGPSTPVVALEHGNWFCVAAVGNPGMLAVPAASTPTALTSEICAFYHIL